MSPAEVTEKMGQGKGHGPLTSKSWYCSSVRDFLATTSTRSPSRAMLPHCKAQKDQWGATLTPQLTQGVREDGRLGNDFPLELWSPEPSF